MRRPRGPGGRFLTAEEVKAKEDAEREASAATTAAAAPPAALADPSEPLLWDDAQLQQQLEAQPDFGGDAMDMLQFDD
jgi:hypothetical protein